ncbi:rRNA bioproteinsis protein rrp5 [Saitoella coloradoensis]
MAGPKRSRESLGGSGDSSSKKRTIDGASVSRELSALRADEQDFPRGGASVLTPLEYKEATNEATRDVLFGTSDAAPEAKRRKTQKPKPNKQQKGGKKQEEETEKKVEGPRIEGLSFKRLAKGTVVLGQISSINALDMVVSLPNNISGYVPITAVSPKLSANLDAEMKNAEDEDAEDGGVEGADLKDLFTVGEWVRVYVTENTTGSAEKKGKKRVEFSLFPELVNGGLTLDDCANTVVLQAAVLSVEDHGLVVDVGINGITGFVAKKDVGTLEFAKIREGQVFLTSVTGIPASRRIVQLTADITSKKASVPLQEISSIDQLLPGTTVNGLVTAVRGTQGLVAKLYGLVDGTVDIFHLDANSNKKYKEGDTIRARVISTFPGSEPRKVALSLLHHVLELTTASIRQGKARQDPLEALPIGTIVEAAKVKKVEATQGLWLDMGVSGIQGFCHISRVADKKIETLSASTGAYKLDSVHRARIVGWAPVDGYYIVSMEEKVLEQKILRVEDVRAGEVIKVEVRKIIGAGIVVEITDSVTGLVPTIHMADTALQNPERKFREGMSVDAKVISTDPSKRRVVLTLKKSLLNSDLPLIQSFEGVEVGQNAVGTLVTLLDNGALVEFFGGVKAFLPVAEMSEAYISNPRDHFRVGQTVSVWVQSVDAENERMRVSCKNPAAWSQGQSQKFEAVEVGGVVSATIADKPEDQIIVSVLPDMIKGIVSLPQLSDEDSTKAKAVHTKLRVGQTLKELAVISKNERSKLLVLSNKQSLIKAAKAGKFLKSLEGVNVGDKVVGYVKNVTDFGVFVGFAGNLVGLALKAHLSEQYVPSVQALFSQGQSVTATVADVNREENRLQLTFRELKPVEDKPKEKKEKKVAPEGKTLAAKPIDQNVTCVEDYQPGFITKAKISSIKESQINVELASNVHGRIDASQIYDSYKDVKNKKNPLKAFNVHQIIDVKVLGWHDAKNHRFLAITHKKSNKGPTVLELTMKPSELKKAEVNIPGYADIKLGEKYTVFVNNVAAYGLFVTLNPNVRGRVNILDVSDNVDEIQNLAEHYPVGAALEVKAVSKDDKNNFVNFSARALKNPITNYESLSVGAIIPARVTKITEQGLIVQLSDELIGRVYLTDIADEYSAEPTKGFEKDQIVRVCVVEVDVSNKRIACSTRVSRTLSSSAAKVDAEINTVNDLTKDSVVRGYVRNVADNGLYVSLGRSVVARVKIAELFDEYVKDWKPRFKKDQLVEGRVASVDKEHSKVEMSLKKKAVSETKSEGIKLTDLEAGQIVDGLVTKVVDYGLFIRVQDSSVSGLCHIAEVSDTKIKDLSKVYSEGDLVKAKVLKIDTDKRRVSFGLKSSYFEDGEEDDEEDDGSEEDGSEDDEEMEIEGLESGEENEDEDEDEDEDMEGFEFEDEDADEGSEDEEEEGDFVEEDDDEDEEMSNASGEEDDESSEKAPALSVGGFDWSGDVMASLQGGAESSDSESEDEDDNTSKKKKKSKKSAVKIDKTADLDKQAPQTSSDYERLLIGSPDSSFLWINYMAFQLQLSEIEKAREIGERALKSINYREEQEKLNVWVAMMNLENTFGSEETLEEVFKRACQYNEPKKVYGHLCDILARSQKIEAAKELYQKTVKKFSQSSKVWSNFAQFLVENSSIEDARALLPRALQSLPKRKHIKTILRFAQMEFKSGDAERGRTIFEGLLSSYPKRLDLWNILLDLEIALGETDAVRRLFNRVLALKLSSKKAKFIFKKWLGFEKEHGDDVSVTEVKERAAEWVAQNVKGDE